MGDLVKWQGRDRMKKRIAQGYWIDADGVGHVSLQELCKLVDLPDTEENHREIIKMFLESGHIEPEAIYRATKDQTYGISADEKSIVCLKCGKRSYNAADVHNKYCGNCHTFHD